MVRIGRPPRLAAALAAVLVQLLVPSSRVHLHAQPEADLPPLVYVCPMHSDQVAHEDGWEDYVRPIGGMGPSGQYVDHRDRKVDGSYGYNADLVTDLPQAGEQKLYLTLTTADPPTARDQQVAEWFRTDSRLVHFRVQTHFNWYTTANPHYRERLYKSYGSGVPIVTLQKPDGEILFHAHSGTGGRMPATSGELADMINAAVQQKYAPPDFSHLEGAGGPAFIREGDCPDGSCDPAPLGPATPIDQVTAVEHPAADRAGAYGMESILVDGNDADEVYLTAVKYIGRARRGGGPALIEAKTYRHSGHSRADPAKYRPDGELEKWLARDPLKLYRERLLKLGVTEGTLADIESQAMRKVDQATAEAKASPPPGLDLIEKDVWADGGAAWRN